MKFVFKPALIALCLASGVPAVASAQDSRLTLSFTPAVATAGGDSQLALAGTVAYRFTNHLAFEGDVTRLDGAANGVGNRNFGPGSPVTGITTVTALQNLGAMFGGVNGLLPAV